MSREVAFRRCPPRRRSTGYFRSVQAVSRCRPAGPDGSARRPACRRPAPAGVVVDQQPTASPTGSLGAEHRQRGLHTAPPRRPGRPRRPNRAPSRPRSLTEPTTSAAITGGSARTTGICETPYSRRIATASAIVSFGWVCTSDGQLAGLLAQHVADRHAPSARARREPVAGQPVVVEHLGQVAAAAVRQQHDDHRVRVVELARPAAARPPPPSRTSRRPAGPPRGPAAGSSRTSRRRRPR